MRSSGNGRPEICVGNILKTTRGTVPYRRIMGLDPTLIDQPSNTALPQMSADVEYNIRTFEPRADARSVDTMGIAAQIGEFGVGAAVNVLRDK